MSKPIVFESTGFIVGKEVVKAREASVGKDGKQWAAKPKMWDLYLVIGDLREKGNLIRHEPIPVTAHTTEEFFKTVRMQSIVSCKVEQSNGKFYHFLNIDGIPLVMTEQVANDEDLDEDEDDESVPAFEPPTDIKKSKKGGENK